MMSTPSPRSLKIAPPKVAPNSFPACNLRDSSCVRLSSRSSRSCLPKPANRSEEHTSELQSREKLVCRLLLEKKKTRRRLTPPVWPMRFAASRWMRLRRPNRATRACPWVRPTWPPCFFFFFNNTAPTEIYTLSLHDALPISKCSCRQSRRAASASTSITKPSRNTSRSEEHTSELQSRENLVCRLLLEKK